MRNERTDWGNISRRLEEATAAIQKGFTPGDEDKKKILRKRAELLAHEPEKRKEGDCIEVVEFLLANEHYGIESLYIHEVYPLKDYTPLPGAPMFVLGLVNVRGRIVSVIDLKKFFDMPDKGISDLNKVIILHDTMMEFGILADSILGTRNIRLDEIQPPPPTLTGIREEFLRGVTQERAVVLDAKRLLTDKSIIVHEEV